MLITVTTPFCGHGYNMPTPGTLIDPPEELARHLLSIGVAARYETKVDPLPDEIKSGNKKKGLSESLPAAPALPKRTRKSSRKSATKS